MSENQQVDNPDELEQATSLLYLAAARFFIAIRKAQHEEQPELAEKITALMRHWQAGLRIELGMLPAIEAGVVQNGRFEPFFTWRMPMDNAVVN